MELTHGANITDVIHGVKPLKFPSAQIFYAHWDQIGALTVKSGYYPKARIFVKIDVLKVIISTEWILTKGQNFCVTYKLKFLYFE